MIDNNTNCFAVIAYRWGWLNAHHYVECVTTDEQAARDAADAEAMHHGGKYGVTVYDKAGNSVYHSPSSYGEKKAHYNYRMQLFEAVGLRVVTALERGEPMTQDQIEVRWRNEAKTCEMFANSDPDYPKADAKESPTCPNKLTPS